MKQLNSLISKAQSSSFYLWILNFFAARLVPFNKSHSLTIKKITPQSIEVELPYRKSNLNHIKGIHACALATLCEYSTGVVLLASINPELYRIILKNIHVTYHYQAKQAVRAKFELTTEWIEREVVVPLKSTDAIFKEFTVEVYDLSNNHICTGLINWQIKSWKKVKS